MTNKSDAKAILLLSVNEGVDFESARAMEVRPDGLEESEEFSILLVGINGFKRAVVWLGFILSLVRLDPLTWFVSRMVDFFFVFLVLEVTWDTTLLTLTSESRSATTMRTS